MATTKEFRYCSLAPGRERVFAPEVSAPRLAAIRSRDKKWVNGTILHYFFFSDGPNRGTEAEKEVVRSAFAQWKALGIGLDFAEVSAATAAEIRIGFVKGNGSWSYVGRDVLNHGPQKRTMNFGWDITVPGEIDTALHEIGHSLGLPHEHQNPHAGIVWDEEAVYADLAKPPNSWNRDKTFFNIIRKIDPDTVQGSKWDPDSIMHYPFKAGLIRAPAPYDQGLNPKPGLSGRDEAWVRAFYPPMSGGLMQLEPLKSVTLALLEGEQRDFSIEPPASREYTMQTFGESDTLLVLFEDEGGTPRYLTADDDSGESYNASIKLRLLQGRRYLLRVRLYYQGRTGQTGLMLW